MGRYKRQKIHLRTLWNRDRTPRKYPMLGVVDSETERKIHAKQMEHIRLGDSQPKALLMACASVLTGISFTPLRRSLQILNIPPVASSTFYQKQNEILEIIEGEAQKTVDAAREKAKDIDSPVVSIDSRWNSKRNGSMNTASAIESSSGDVIAYKNTIKRGGRRDGDYEGPSNLMESNGINSIADDLKETFGDKTITIVQDGDNKSTKIYDSKNLNIEREFDKNHGKGVLQRAFEPIQKELYMKHKIQNPFHGVKGKMLNWGQYLIDNVDDEEERAALWLNAPNHLIGDHSLCHHPDKEPPKRGRPPKTKVKSDEDYKIWTKGKENPLVKNGLDTFCKRTEYVIRNASPSHGTNANESLNASIAKYANKRIAFGKSYGARAAVAIGNKNDPENFTMNVLQATGAINYIDQSIQDQMQRDINTEIRKNEIRKTPYERNRANQARKAVRNSYKSQKEGDYNENKEATPFLI